MEDSARPHSGGERGSTCEAQREFFTLWLERLEDQLKAELGALRAFLEERDRRYMEKFLASETAVQAALTAAKEAVSAALVSNEKATAKAEAAQQDYNVRSNEFRGQLDDQAKMLMPRAEAQALIVNLTERMEGNKSLADSTHTELKRDIAALREDRSVREGQHSKEIESRQQVQWGSGQALAVALVVVGIAFSLAIAYVGAHP